MTVRVLVCCLLAVFACSAACAQEAAAKAREWRSYCQGYLKALDGDPKASDLDVTYCVGITQGLANGLRIGAQLGALSLGSTIAIKYNLDPDAIFKLFEAQGPARLLGICSPETHGTADYVRAVLKRLDERPADLERPIAEVFYEALQSAYPCT